MAVDNNKELDWQEYEAVIKHIYEMMGAGYGIRVRDYGRDCWVTGKSGVKHQVDVLTEQLDGNRCVLTAIECKFLKKKVTKEIVMKLHSVMADADIASGIIVCRAGYTPDTMAYAEHLGIKLVELREAGADDLNGEHTIKFGILDIHGKVTILRPIMTKIDLGSKVITDEREIMAMHYVRMRTLNGIEVPFGTFISAFRKELDKHEKMFSTITRPFDAVNEKLIWNNGENELAIEKITITGFLAEIDDSFSRSFQLVDQVWMIMKEIFEKKAFTFSKTGMLYRSPPE